MSDLFESASKISIAEQTRNAIEAVANAATEEEKKAVADLLTKAKSVGAEVVKITPGMAALIFIHNNAHNRDWIASRSLEYLRRMREKLWRFNGQSGAFYQTGELADAQHRLAAAALNGETIEMTFSFGIERDAIATIDNGIARHASDAAKLEGINDAKRKQTVIKNAYSYDTKRGDVSKVLKSEAEIAKAITDNDAALSTALELADESVIGVHQPYFKPVQAASIAMTLLLHGWPADAITAHLKALQLGDPNDTGDKTPGFVAIGLLEKSRAKKNKSDHLNTMMEVGVAVMAIRERQKGTAAIQERTLKEAVRKTLPDPTYPAPPPLAEAAE
jgi:hypothetical protein